MSLAERRNYIRYDLRHDVLLHCDGLGMVRGTSNNLSAGGMWLICANVSLALHQDIELSVVPGRSAEGILRIPATIVRAGKDGYGVQFKRPLSPHTPLFQ